MSAGVGRCGVAGIRWLGEGVWDGVWWCVRLCVGWGERGGASGVWGG
jgi:hypothetical protein